MCVFYFKKAFDTVSHRKLMNILCEIGTHPVLLSWLCSYLSGRQQYVLVNGMHFECCHMSGVPQGSVLGPLLFLIYINSLTYIPLSDSTRLTLYADDLLIYKPIPIESSHLQLQSDINSISLWADNNLMTFNASKCKCMLLTIKKHCVSNYNFK